ncbi:uncharacterized protein [Pleurodeles waltl]|uniref:uncharacterized protein isoform X1 n=1 Tax=Pleurodeles waltl TaxID=8319 RepID=UPI00370982AA
MDVSPYGSWQGPEYPSEVTNKSKEKCWYEDTFPDSFLPGASSTKLHKPSPEILDRGQPQRPTNPQTLNHKVPTTTEVHNTSAQLAASMSAADQHSGSQDAPKVVDPGRSLSVPSSVPDSTCIRKPAAVQQSNSATAPSGADHQRRPPGLDEEILSVLTDPMFASGLRVLKLMDILRYQRGIDLDDLSWELGYQDVLDLLQQVPNAKLRNPSKGVDCVIQFQPGFPDGPKGVHPGQSLSVSTSAPDSTCISNSTTAPSGANHQRRPPGLDEEILSVLTDPMFASGLRVLKLMDILRYQRGIDLDDLSWELGYQDVLDLLQQVPNAKLRDPSKGVDCVIQFQPGHYRISDATNSSEEKCWSEDTLPDSFMPSSSPTPQHKSSSEILDTGQPQRIVTPQTQHHQASTTTETQKTSAQPVTSMSAAGQHSGSQDGPKGVLPGQSLPASMSAPDSTCISKPAALAQRNSATSLSGANHQRRPPGLNEEILNVITRPMFASGLRVLKLIELLSHERGIDLDDLSWGLGYQDVLDLLQQVPNAKLLDPSKGEDCVIKFQPGSLQKREPLLPCPLGRPPIYSSNQMLRTELPNSQYSQYGTSNAFKHFPSNAPWFPSQKPKSAAVYISKNHQKPGPPQQKRKPGMTLVFRASKTPASAGVLQSIPPTKSPAVQHVFSKPSEEAIFGPLKACPTPAHPNSIPQGQNTLTPYMQTAPIQLLASTSSEDDCTVKGLDPILKDEILVVLLQQPRGVAFGEFAGLFHRTHGYQFKLCRHGFTSLRALLDEMIDLVDVSEDPVDPLIKCKRRHHYVFIGGGPFSSQIEIL